MACINLIKCKIYLDERSRWAVTFRGLVFKSGPRDGYIAMAKRYKFSSDNLDWTKLDKIWKQGSKGHNSCTRIVNDKWVT